MFDTDVHTFRGCTHKDYKANNADDQLWPEDNIEKLDENCRKIKDGYYGKNMTSVIIIPIQMKLRKTIFRSPSNAGAS